MGRAKGSSLTWSQVAEQAKAAPAPSATAPTLQPRVSTTVVDAAADQLDRGEGFQRSHTQPEEGQRRDMRWPLTRLRQSGVRRGILAAGVPPEEPGVPAPHGRLGGQRRLHLGERPSVWSAGIPLKSPARELTC